jgi:hypothetical protein
MIPNPAYTDSRAVVGIEMRWFSIPGVPGSRKPGWSCDYCGTAIAECCTIRDINGKQFIVGNECVLKTGDTGLIDTVKRALNAKRREARAAKLIEQRSEATALLAHPAVVATLSAQPHPNNYFASKGKTNLDYFAFVIERVNSEVPAALKTLRNLAVSGMVDASAEAKAAALTLARIEAAAAATAKQAAEETAKASVIAANGWLIEALMPHASFDGSGFATNFFGSIVKELEAGRAMASLPPKAIAILASRLAGRSKTQYDAICDRINGVPSAPALVAEILSVGDYAPVIEMFRHAKKTLKFPAFNLLVGEHEIRLYLAGPNSKHSGNVMVVGKGKFENRSYFGTITPEGKWKPGRDAESDPAFMASLTTMLSELATDPHAVVAKYGSLTGHCCFCNLPLSEDHSTTVGYGRKCAENYGLLENWKAAQTIGVAPKSEGMTPAQKAWATRRARMAA